MPDLGVFIVSLIVFIACRKLTRQSEETNEEASAPSLSGSVASLVKTRVIHPTALLDILGEFLIALFLAASGIAFPSILSAVYFLTFLYIATWWACYKSLGRKFAVCRILLLVYSGSNLLLLYLYQFQFFQEFLTPQSFYAR